MKKIELVKIHRVAKVKTPLFGDGIKCPKCGERTVYVGISGCLYRCENNECKHIVR